MKSRSAFPRFLAVLILLESCTGSMSEESNLTINTAYKDPKQPLDARINSLLGQMTLEEKVGQMAQLDLTSVSPQMMRDFSIGSILSGPGSVPHRFATPKQWVDMINSFQNASLSSRLGIPMIYGTDAIHGHNNINNATIFPHNVGLGATRDPDLVKRIGAATAIETRATGVTYAFAPCVAVCRDPRWGRCFESYSEDPEIVEQMTELIYGLQGDVPSHLGEGVPYVGGKHKVAACAKHFVGDGGTTNGINENNTVLDWQELQRIHMPGYYQSIKKGVSTIMVSYSSWNGMKMHANRYLITDFLKGTLGFKGFVISDWEGVDKITYPPHANYSDSLLKAINAGIDMVMIPFHYTEFSSTLISHVKNNRVPVSRINDAVRRILKVKFIMGLFEDPVADYSLVDQVGSQAHRNLAREAVRKSLVLLKNNENFLPLPKKTNQILVTGSHANSLSLQCGGWTNTDNPRIGTTILDAISATVDSSTKIVYNENPSVEFLSMHNFSYTIVIVGEPSYEDGMGDDTSLTIPEQGIRTITDACATTKCVVVLISGRPLVIEPYLSSINALVAAWFPGSEGQGVADVLFGDYGFTGKLPRTWFRRVDQLPMNVGDRYSDPLFPFGFGLTTTELYGNITTKTDGDDARKDLSLD